MPSKAPPAPRPKPRPLPPPPQRSTYGSGAGAPVTPPKTPPKAPVTPPKMPPKTLVPAQTPPKAPVTPPKAMAEPSHREPATAQLDRPGAQPAPPPQEQQPDSEWDVRPAESWVRDWQRTVAGNLGISRRRLEQAMGHAKRARGRKNFRR